MEAIISAGEGIANVSNIGATLTKWVLEGEDIIYPFRHIGQKQRGGIPICCPFFGLAPKEFEDIPQHGWFRNLETTWHHDTQAKVASHKSYKGEYKSFPWWLVANITHEVISYRNEDILDTRLKLYRVSSEGEMPINVAFHPYFRSYGKRDVFINGEKHVVDVSTKAKCIKINSNDEIIIDTGKLCIKMILSGYDYDTCLYLWGDAQEYFCVEPVLTPPSCFNTTDGVWLSQQQSIDVSMKLSILF